jgi:pyruvate dehydrogenase E1 component alpha subunit
VSGAGAYGPGTEPDVEREHGLGLLREMVRIRLFEERCVELYSAGEIRGFVHLYIGEEAVAVGVNAVLEPRDAIVGTYREHGHALARGIPMRAVMAEMYGRSEGCSGGRGGSMHLFDRATRFYGGNAIVGGGLPVAVGLALAEHLAPGGGPAVAAGSAVTACFFGEGAVAEGEFHESMNLAALWRLPVLFCCENNLYAMGTALDRSESEVDLALKASSYEMPAWSVDGMDVLAVEGAAARALAAIRAGGGPCFLELRTYRFRAHSLYDPERYRGKEEVEAWKVRDPIGVLAARLAAAGLLEDGELAAIEAEVGVEIDDAVAHARTGTLEPVDQLERWVVSDR